VLVGARVWYRIVCREICGKGGPGQIFSLCARLERESPCVPAKETGDRIVKRRQGFSELFIKDVHGVPSLIFGESQAHAAINVRLPQRGLTTNNQMVAGARA
jgi:hypothetical protein